MSQATTELASSTEVGTEVCPWCEQPVSRGEFKRIEAKIRQQEQAKLQALRAKIREENEQELRTAVAKLRKTAEEEKTAAVQAAQAVAEEALAAERSKRAQVNESIKALEAGHEEELQKASEASRKAIDELQATLKQTKVTAEEDRKAAMEEAVRSASSQLTQKLAVQAELIEAQKESKATLEATVAALQKEMAESAESTQAKVEAAVSEAVQSASAGLAQKLEAQAALFEAERESKAALEASLVSLQEEMAESAESAQARVEAAISEADLRHREDIAKQRELFEEAGEKALAKQQAESRREREKLEKKLADMTRQLQNRTANELGEGAEIDLFDALRDAFPDDRIERIQKGQPGADIRHEVLDAGETAGIILYDSKNHKAWRSSFAEKLRSDQVAAGADYGVLATTCFPSGHKELCEVGQVLLVSPARAAALVQVLRTSILHLHSLRLSGKERSTKAALVYEFVRGEAFAQHLKRADELTDEILQIDVEEQKAHQKVWRRRGESARSLARQIAEVQTEVQSLLRG